MEIVGYPVRGQVALQGWSAVNGHDEIVARAANLIVGRAAYETARWMFPNKRIDYRDGARIIARSDQSEVLRICYTRL
jgi:hypothetical protein